MALAREGARVTAGSRDENPGLEDGFDAVWDWSMPAAGKPSGKHGVPARENRSVDGVQETLG